MTATPDLMSRLKRRDIDPFDSFCDHLLVVDHKEKNRKSSAPIGFFVRTWRRVAAVFIRQANLILLR